MGRRVVLELGEMGLIKIVRGPTKDRYCLWKLDKASVKDFHKLIIKRIGQNSPQGEVIDLTRAAHISANVGLSSAGIIRCVVHGEIQAFLKTGDSSSGLKNLVFQLTDIRDLCNEVKQENGWMDKREIMNRMNMSLKAVNAWISSGLINSVAVCNNIQHFDKTEMKQFCEENSSC